MHYFWNVKNVFFKAILKLCSFSFCIWFYVFAPGSHCFAIGILNRPAICTVHFRPTWIAPLRFSTCRSWAGSTVTAAKLDPKKSKFHLPNWMFKCVFFHMFYIFSHFFTCFFAFFPSAFSKRIFSHFSKRIFKTHVFTCVHIFYIFVKQCEKMRFENALGKNVKNAFWKCEQKCEKWEQGSWKVPVS